MKLSSATVMVVCSFGSLALANREPATVYGARSVGMGGTAVAISTGSGAAFHNPALLSEVDNLELGLTFSPYYAQPSGPWPDPATFDPVTRDSRRRMAPLGMISGAYRVHDRVVVGLASFAAGGGGALYERVPIAGDNDVDISALVLELQLPVAIRISDVLHVGAAYRVAYGRADVSTAQFADPTDPSQGFVRTESSFSGATFAALQLGLHYQPVDNVAIGFNYRSKLSTDMTGETKIDGTVVAEDLELNSSEPHKVVLGAATRLLGGSLLVAADARYWLYSESHKKNMEEGRAADWKNAVSLGVGAELHVANALPLRVGYSVGRMATTAGAASAF